MTLLFFAYLTPKIIPKVMATTATTATTAVRPDLERALPPFAVDVFLMPVKINLPADLRRRWDPGFPDRQKVENWTRL